MVRRISGGLALAVLATVATGCLVPRTAMVDGKALKRPTLQYTDARYFKLIHEGVHPAAVSASSGLWADGGRITGRICGGDVVYDVWHAGRTDYVTGFISRSSVSTINHPVKLILEDTEAGRTIEGVAGQVRVDLRLTPERIEGLIRLPFYDRRFDLHAEGDDLVGTVSLADAQLSPIRVRGRSALWAMPPAAQAALLPPMLTCNMEGGLMNGLPVDTIDLRHDVALAEPPPPGTTPAPAAPPEPPPAEVAPPAPENPSTYAALVEYDHQRIGYVLSAGQSGVAGFGVRTWSQAAFYQGRYHRWFGDTYEFLEVAGEPGEADRYRDRRRLRLTLLGASAAAAVVGVVLTGVAFGGIDEAQKHCTNRYVSSGACVDRFEAVTAGTKAELGLGIGLGAAAIIGVVIAGWVPGSNYTLRDHILVAERYNERLRRRLGLAALGVAPTDVVVAPTVAPGGAGMQLSMRF